MPWKNMWISNKESLGQICVIYHMTSFSNEPSMQKITGWRTDKFNMHFQIYFPFLHSRPKILHTWEIPSSHSQGNGPIWHVETCPDFIFFTAKVHTTKSIVKILAANKHCKYFLKIAQVTHFSVCGTSCTRGLYNLLCHLMSRPLQHLPRLSQPYHVLHTAPGSAMGGHFSKGLAGYNIGNV
jgi:hypothetical protein